LLSSQSLPRILADSLQRSDGEEEEDGFLTLSPASLESSPDSDQLHWEGLALPLPVTFEQELEGGISVCLVDLVRQMHPYCMSICMEDDEGEQMLPEGGILLEVVDQGENGEHILVIQNINLPVALPLKEQSSENRPTVSDEAEEVASDSSEHIVVDDDDETPVTVAALLTPSRCSDLKDNMIIKKQKEVIKGRSPSRRKKKKKCKEKPQPKPVEERVLRSGTVRKTAPQSPKKPEKRPVKEENKRKVPKVPLVSSPASSSVKPKKRNSCQIETQTKITTTTLLPKRNVPVATSVSTRKEMVLLNTRPETSRPRGLPTAVFSQRPVETPKPFSPVTEKLEDSSAAPSAVLPPLSSESPAAASSLAEPQLSPPVGEALPPVAPAVSEPKPKSLSLAEYRRLREQKRPSPVEKQENSTKWPSLSELPNELPTLPCLPDPNPKDHRRPNRQPEVEEEVKPAWQPRGPCAPPTPQALLVPPAYMVASSSRVTPVSKPQQKPEPSKPSVSLKPLTSAFNSVTNVPLHPHTTAQPVVSCVPQSSASPVSFKVATELVAAANWKCSSAPSGGKSGVDKKPQSQSALLKSGELIQIYLKTTTNVIKPNTLTVSGVPSAPQKTIVLQKVPEVTAPVLISNPSTLVSKSSKPTANGNQRSCSLVTHPSVSRSLKAKPVVLETKNKLTTATKPQKAKSATQELIEAFTAEMGEFKVDCVF